MALASIRLPLYGLLAGVLLSAMRAPLGLDWTQFAVVESTTASLFRAAALVTIALFMDPRRAAFREGTRPLVLLPAISAGFLLHGLFLDLAFQPGCRLGIAIAFVSATLLMWLVAGRVAKDSPTTGAEARALGLPRGERFGLGVAGLGLTLALETVAQHLRLLGQGLPADDTVIGSFLLIWVAFMTLCFGFSLPSSAGRHGSLSACALAFAAALCLYALKFLSGLGREGLYAFLKGVPLLQVDSSFIATWPATAWISASSLVPIGLALAIAVLGAQHPLRLASILIGASLGLLLRPFLIEALVGPIHFPEGADNAWAWELLALGALVAGLGAMLCARGERGARRLVLSLLGLLAGATPLIFGLFSPVVIWSFSPWLAYDAQANLVIPSGVGVVSVEERPGNSIQVNVDRRRVTPSIYEQDVDYLRLEYSLALCPPERLQQGQLRVLLLGQLTPERDSYLRLAGVKRLDRSASWYSAMPAVEAELFGPDREPLGQLIAPGQARARLKAGEYDLVIALPAGAPDLSPRGRWSPPYSSASAPIFNALEVPEGTLGVAWVDGSAPLHTRSMGPWAILAMDRMDHLTVGLIYGDVDTEPSIRRPMLFATGAPLWPATIWTETLELLNTKVSSRVFGPREDILRRLGQAAEGDAGASIASALEQHFALQVPSSPFDTAAAAIEWQEEVFAQLFAAIGSRPHLDPFSRSLGEALFWVLTEKRLSDLVIVYGEALADKFTPWPAADRALANAYEELLEPAEGLRLWQRLIEADPYDLDAYLRAADAAIEAEVPEEAAKTLQQALKIQPGRFDLKRALGIALQQAGDPAGEQLLNELLSQEPEDNLIRGALGLELVPELDDPHDHH